MFVVFPSRGIGAAAFAAGLLLAGCSSDSDVPPTTVSAPGGGTQANTDTGSGGNFPDVNTTPTQRPTSTIQDLVKAPNGLAAAPGGTQYSEALVGGPTSTAAPPPPPPPPEPPQEALAPTPDPGIQEQGSESTPTTPQVAEPQPEPAPEPEPVAEPTEPQGEGQTIQGTIAQTEPQPEPQPEPEPAPVASAPEPVEPIAPTVAEPQVAEPSQPAPVAAPQPSYGSNQAAQAPEAYGVSPPQQNGQTYNSTQVAAAAPGPAPNQGQQRYGGDPVGLIYFRDGSSELGADDRRVIEQIAEIQRAYGGVVSVIGHSSVGGTGADKAANQRISEARATAVAQELMRYGVPLEAIRAGAAGDSQPLYSEAATNGAAGNRRVEVYITAY